MEKIILYVADGSSVSKDETYGKLLKQLEKFMKTWHCSFRFEIPQNRIMEAGVK